jgi:Lon-like protease
VTETPANGSPAPPPPHTGISRRTAASLIAVFVLIVLAAAASLVHLPYAILKPGPALNTLGKAPDGKDLISVNGQGTYPTSGELDFTTVSVYGGPGNPVNLYDVLSGWLDPSSLVLPAEQLFPKGQSSKQIESQNLADMTSSQQVAAAVALRNLGQQVPQVVVVREVQPGAPAAGKLQPGDVLVAVDGAPVQDAASVRAAIQKHQPGQAVQVTVRRGGAEKVVTVSTRDVNGRAVLGIILETRFELPVKVDIDAGNVGGPSAGLMFSLGVYDKLTPGALTGGARIAGTGTLDPSGQVGPIGGIQQKMVGARQEGATWFLAPADNCNEVVGHVPDGLRVVKVSTFTQARDAVEAIAARQTSGLPTCQSTSAAR